MRRGAQNLLHAPMGDIEAIEGEGAHPTGFAIQPSLSNEHAWLYV